MKILYLANIRLPTEKAHGAQIVKMCEAFARAGHQVELVVTDRRTPITEGPFAYYGVEHTFTITRIPVRDTVAWGRMGFLLETYIFARRAARHVKKANADIVFGRDEMVLYFVPRTARLVWETHTGAWNFFVRQVIARATRIVAISHGLKDFYVSRGVPLQKLMVAHDGVDLKAFAHPQSKADARARLQLPQDEKIALYIGRLDGWKGVGTLLEASRLLHSARVVIIGGEPAQIAMLSMRYPNVRFLGSRPYRELADNQAAGDVLVLPNTGIEEVSVRFTSPLKLFSYMAAGRPIVASNLPSIREVLGEEDALLVQPDDAQALAEGIERVLSDNALAERLAQSAHTKVEAYTWDRRAHVIIESL